MNNGTSTLHSLLMALNIGPEMRLLYQVLLIYPANVILYQGATPVLCDNDPLTFNTTVSHIKKLQIKQRLLLQLILKVYLLITMNLMN